MPLPLFSDAQFSGIPATLPVGIDAPTNPSHMVRLLLTTGEIVTFGSVLTMMRLITRMRRDGVHTICPTEETFVALAGASKLLIGEQTFQLQKLQHAGSFGYSQGRLEVRMRAGACVETLDGALACVGHYRPGPTPYQSTADLLVPLGAASPRLLVVDYRYNEDGSGTTFVDSPPIQERAPL